MTDEEHNPVEDDDDIEWDTDTSLVPFPTTAAMRAAGMRADRNSLTREELAKEELAEQDRYKLWGLQEWADQTPPTPLIRRFWSMGRIAVMVAPPGSYKSFVAMDLAVRLALGDSDTGLDIPEPLRVVYVAGEGAYGWITRLQAMDDKARSAPVKLGVNPWTADPEAGAEYNAGLDSLAEIAPDLVVFDTLQTVRMMGEGDTNRADVIAKLFDYARQLEIAVRERYPEDRPYHRVTLLFVHHTGKAVGAGPRGSSAIVADADQVWMVKRAGTPEAPKAKVVTLKARDLPPSTWTVDLQLVPDADDPDEIMSLRVVKWTEDMHRPVDGMPEEKLEKDAFRARLEEWRAARPDDAATGDCEDFKTWHAVTRRAVAKLPRGAAVILRRWQEKQAER